MVRIRLKRMGRRNRPFFRICVADAREERDGRMIEDVGTYDPLVAQDDKKITLKADRVRYWLSVGAQPSESAAALLRNMGIELPGKKTKKRKSKKDAAPAKAAGQD